LVAHAPSLFNHAQPLDVTVPSFNRFAVWCFQDLALIGCKGMDFALGKE
jgi:hypothetical protein